MHGTKTVIRYVKMILSALNKDFILKFIYIYRRAIKTENQISRADAFIFWRHYYSACISPKLAVIMSYFLFNSRFWIIRTLQYENFPFPSRYRISFCLKLLFLFVFMEHDNKSIFFIFMISFVNIHSICFMNITYLHYEPFFHKQ